MEPTPEAVLQAVQKLVADDADIKSKKEDANTKKEAATEAMHESQEADTSVTASTDQFAKDKQALHDLIDSTWPT